MLSAISAASNTPGVKRSNKQPGTKPMLKGLRSKTGAARVTRGRVAVVPLTHPTSDTKKPLRENPEEVWRVALVILTLPRVNPRAIRRVVLVGWCPQLAVRSRRRHRASKLSANRLSGHHRSGLV